MFGGLGILYSLILGAGVMGRNINLSSQDAINREEARKNPNITGTYVAHDGLRDIATNKKVIIHWKDGFQQVIDVENSKVIRDCGSITMDKRNAESMKKGSSIYSDTYPFYTVTRYSYKGNYIRLSDRLPKYRNLVYQDIKTGELLIERRNGHFLAKGDGTYVRYNDWLRNSKFERGVYDPQEEAEKIKQLNEQLEEDIREIMENETLDDNIKQFKIAARCEF